MEIEDGMYSIWISLPEVCFPTIIIINNPSVMSWWQKRKIYNNCKSENRNSSQLKWSDREKY